MERSGCFIAGADALGDRCIIKMQRMTIEQKAIAIRNDLKTTCDDVSNPLDNSLDKVILPFKGQEEIKLIIIGQDPTIKNEKTRKLINITLNLDKGNALTTYIKMICKELGITINNVYATNLFKYFYEKPPAQTFKVLQRHLVPNLRLLDEELSLFKDIPVITLGEPLLRLLTFETDKVRKYWGYDPKTGKSRGTFQFAIGMNNLLERNFYPFPHQPSLRKDFYNENMANYLHYVKSRDFNNE